ncbi:MAG: hypothetical protein A2074_08440 [Candidatus Aquicultor primus]|uniref:4Fe-4S ferredoxin-type domain-containing protein n=1 Tax=Candidatus Aquicultor primus TaxID=1797195 RepID=A0A1F2UFH3_9ACTN|nr:MAG: hypothetical protein A2074_08440 [Candidatus Aquicultor primus]
MNIGLYLSESNGEVSQVIDLNKLAGEYGDLPAVKVFDNIFKSRSINQIKVDIASNKLDGVVIAGESPHYYKTNREADFIIKEIEASGVNLNRIGFANIREQAAFPHKNDSGAAYAKAKLLIDVAMEKVRHSQQLETIEFPPKRKVAVVGVTIEGAMVAERLLSHGYRVYLIDKEPKARISEEEMSQLRTSIGYILGHKNLKVLSETTIDELIGHEGDFVLTVDKNGQTEQLPVGAVVITAGDDSSYINDLRSVFYLDVDENGSLRPVNRDTMVTTTLRHGIFMVPVTGELGFKAAYADSAALNVISILDADEVIFEVPVSQVNERLCGGCGTCIKTCMFKASSIDESKRLAHVDVMRCRGCGNCVTSCPTGARDLLTYPTKYLHAAIEILADYPSKGDPKLLFLLCESCGYPSLDYAGTSGMEYPASILPLGVKCGARIDTQLILEAFAKGFDGVIIGKCKEDRCQNLVGSVDLDRRANLFREILRSRGINSERLRIVGLDGCESGKAADEAGAFFKDLKAMEVVV